MARFRVTYVDHVHEDDAASAIETALRNVLEDSELFRQCATAREVSSEVEAQMASEFTPGPWNSQMSAWYRTVVSLAERGRGKGWVSIAQLAYCGGRSEANGHLIAAAPEMYAALQAAYNSMARNNGPFDPEVWAAAVNAVSSAIAKAEGRNA